MISKRMVVSMDGHSTAYNAYELDTKGWNGFACPGFTYEEAMKVCEGFSDIMHDMVYDANLDTFVLRGPDGVEDLWKGSGYETEDGPIKLYSIGAWGYCWSWEKYSHKQDKAL